MPAVLMAVLWVRCVQHYLVLNAVSRCGGRRMGQKIAFVSPIDVTGVRSPLRWCFQEWAYRQCFRGGLCSSLLSSSFRDTPVYDQYCWRRGRAIKGRNVADDWNLLLIAFNLSSKTHLITKITLLTKIEKTIHWL